MAIRNAQYGTYNQTVGVRLDMDDAIDILSPTDVPLQTWVGSESTNEVKVEWLEEDLTPQSDTIAGVPTGTGPWTVTVSDTNIFRVGDVLWKEGAASAVRSEEHTSELHSPCNLVGRLLLEKTKRRHVA